MKRIIFLAVISLVLIFFYLCEMSNAETKPADSNDGTIMTVLGPIEAKSFGKALVHEHIMCDFIGAKKVHKNRYKSNEVFSTMLPYLEEIKKQGFSGFVDCSPAYIGRDVRVLRRLSDISGLHILTNTGYYGAMGDKFLPPHAFTETEDELAARWISEWKNGIDGTKIRPGFIKIGVDPGSLSDIDKKIVKAAARTHLKTGLPVACHTGEKKAAQEVLNIIISEGVDPSALIIVHADGIATLTTHFKIAGKGAWVEYDSVGGRPIKEHVRLIKQMIKAGYADRILISHDAGWYQIGEPNGGKERIRSYTAINNDLIPKLKAEGLDEKMLEKLFIDNPKNAFTNRKPGVK